jgi:hypothetical protein
MSVVFDKVREVRWASMGDAAGRLGHLSGREIIEGIRDGRVPPSPLALLIGFRVVEVKEGEVAIRARTSRGPRKPFQRAAWGSSGRAPGYCVRRGSPNLVACRTGLRHPKS